MSSSTAHKIKIDYCKGLSWGGPDDQDISGLSSTIQPIRQIRSSIIEFPASLVDSSPCSHQVRRSSKARDLHRLGSLYDEWEWMSRRKQWRWPWTCCVRSCLCEAAIQEVAAAKRGRWHMVYGDPCDPPVRWNVDQSASGAMPWRAMAAPRPRSTGALVKGCSRQPYFCVSM